METKRVPVIELANAKRDIDALASLVDAYRVFYGQTSDRKAAYAFVRERFAEHDTLFFVVRGDDGEVLGFAHLLFSLDTISLRRIGILEDIYVLESARGGGLGGALLDAAEAYARERGLARLTLSTAHQNRVAQRLYLAHGYVPDQRFRSFNRFLTNEK
ncbi:MAG: GNAT family N-acetyltransferase [Candidatus Eremiobacteraeota bacterium]|nr:GNAT family N-acetyltransferase [Candidatus Eremiobacteraeota bacterium]